MQLFLTFPNGVAKPPVMRNLLLLITIFSVVLSLGCGGATSDSDSGGSSSDFSNLTYPEAAELYTEKGLDATELTGNLASSHNAFLTLDTDVAGATEMQTALDNFADDLEIYATLLEDVNSLEGIIFPDSSANLIASATRYQSVDPSGVDSLNTLTDTMLAKKTECEALFALVTSLPSTPADFEKLARAQQCAREAQLLGISNGFDAAIVSGAGGGAAVIYLGGTVAKRRWTDCRDCSWHRGEPCGRLHLEHVSSFGLV